MGAMDAGSLFDGLRALNAVDVTLLAWLTYAALAGMRTGLVSSVLRLIALGASLAFAATQYGRLLEPVRGAGLWFLSGAFAEVVAFLVTLVAARVVAGFVASALSSAWKRTGGKLPVLGVADTLLGVVPGLTRGVIIGALAVMPLRELTLVPTVSDTVVKSVVAGRLLQVTGTLVPPVRTIAGIE